jgi:hypothetical protein
MRSDFTPSTSAGTTSLPSSSTSQCTGRAKAYSCAPQRIGLGIGIALSASARCPAAGRRSSRRASPRGARSARPWRRWCVPARPVDAGLRAKPSSAGSAAPFASSAMLRYGPSTSLRCSGCSASTPAAAPPGGAACTAACASPRRSRCRASGSAAITPSKKACARPGKRLDRQFFGAQFDQIFVRSCAATFELFPSPCREKVPEGRMRVRRSP